MVKTLVVTLSVDIPDTVLSSDATVTVGTISYAGKVTGIIIHEAEGSIPPTTSVTLKGTNLSVA